jgi:hypothetical protein
VAGIGLLIQRQFDGKDSAARETILRPNPPPMGRHHEAAKVQAQPSSISYISGIFLPEKHLEQMRKILRRDAGSFVRNLNGGLRG